MAQRHGYPWAALGGTWLPTASALAFIASGLVTSATVDVGDLSGLVTATLAWVRIVGFGRHHVCRPDPDATIGSPSAMLGTVGRFVA